VPTGKGSRKQPAGGVILEDDGAVHAPISQAPGTGFDPAKLPMRRILASMFHEKSNKVIKRHRHHCLTCVDARTSLHQGNHQRVRVLTTIVAGRQARRCRS
jgi:hypothetical protein